MGFSQELRHGSGKSLNKNPIEHVGLSQYEVNCIFGGENLRDGMKLVIGFDES